MAQIQVPALPANSGVNDDDLIHIRQGATDRKITAQDLIENLPAMIALLDDKASVAQVDTKISNVITTMITADDPAWTPNPLTKAIKFTVIGAGGQGGGVSSTTSGHAASAGGGGAGGVCIGTTNDLDSSYAIVTGIGGNGASAGDVNGGNGTPSSVTGVNLGTLLANGGDGGNGGANGTFAHNRGGQGGDSSGGDLNLNGTSGNPGVSGGNGGDNDPYSIGLGGIGFLGGSVRTEVSVAPIDETNYGTGGQGAASNGANPAIAGADGGNGVVIIEEFI